MADFNINVTGTIANDSVTNAKLANMAQGTIKGRAAAAGTGDPQDLTGAQVLTITGAVAGPASSTNNNVPQWDGTTGKLLKDGLGISTGGNGSADGGKLVRFRADGDIYFSNNAGSSPSISALSTGAGDGIYSSADAGDGIMAVSVTGKAVHAIASGNEPAVHANGQGTGPAIEVEQNGGVGADIATFHDGTGNGMEVKSDGGLEWTSATGAQTTADNLPVVQDGDVLSTGLTFPDNGFKLTEEGGGANTLTIRVDEVLSDDRILNLQVSNGDKTVNVTGDAELSGTNTGDETTTTLGSKINGATEKTTPVDADMVGLMDSAASNILKKLSWANIKAGLWSAWGALINGGTSKATPVDADALAIMDSAATNATKKLTWANLKATLKTYFDTLYVLSPTTTKGDLIASDGSDNVRVAVGSDGQRLVASSAASTGVAWQWSEMRVTMYAGQNNIAMTNQPNSAQIQPTSNANAWATRMDLTNAHQIRFGARVGVGSASANSPRLILRYYTSLSATASDWLDIGTSEVSASLASTGIARSSWIDITALAKADVFVTIISDGGNGTADPEFSAAYFEVR